MARHPDRFNCDECSHQNCDDDNPAGFPRWEIPGVIISEICLKPMVNARSAKLMWLYGFYKEKVLPFDGGVLEQPAAFIEAMRIIELLASEKIENADTQRQV